MRTKVQEVVSDFIQELADRHPNVIVELLEDKNPWVDQRVRVKCASQEDTYDVSETVAELTTKYYLDQGVYITGPVYHPASEQW
jgi:aromatic ring hydroxylase